MLVHANAKTSATTDIYIYIYIYIYIGFSPFTALNAFTAVRFLITEVT